MKVVSKLIGLAFAIVLLILLTPAVHAGGNDNDLPAVPCSQNKVVGCVMTTLDGVPVYFNGMDPSADEGAWPFGYKWQCVELIQRYYAVKYNYPGIWAPLYAYQAFDDWGHPSSMIAYPNGSSTPPQEGDVLVFDATWGDPYGHVALVKSVADGKITFVQQNVYDIGEDSLPIDAHNNITNQGIYTPIRGWMRDKSANHKAEARTPPVTAQPDASAPPPAAPQVPVATLRAVLAQDSQPAAAAPTDAAAALPTPSDALAAAAVLADAPAALPVPVVQAPQPSGPKVIHEETFDLGQGQWKVKFDVTSGGKYELDLDGRRIMKGDSNQSSDWIVIDGGKHTVQLYANPDVDAHMEWSTQEVTTNQRHFITQLDNG